MTFKRIPPSAGVRNSPKCAVVVLGAAVGADGLGTPVMKRRVDRAVALMAAGKGDILVLSGGSIAGRPAEAEVMAALAARQGIPADRIVPESRSRNTRENARFTLSLLAQRWQIAEVVVVSDLWHLPRALMLFRRLAPPGMVVRGGAAAARPARPGWWMSALREIPAFAVDLVRAGRR